MTELCKIEVTALRAGGEAGRDPGCRTAFMKFEAKTKNVCATSYSGYLKGFYPILAQDVAPVFTTFH